MRTREATKLSEQLRRLLTVRFGLLALCFWAAGCTTDPSTQAVETTVQSSTTAAEGTSTSMSEESSEEAAPTPLPFGFRRCSALLPTGIIDGPVSEDPEIARAQQWRADNGWQSDEEWVREVSLQDTTSTYNDALEFPVTDDEFVEFLRREADLDTEALDAYTAEHEATFGGYWLDLPTRSPTISFTEDVDVRRSEVAERVPGVRVIEANLSEIELLALQIQLTEELSARGLSVIAGVLVQAGGGVVGIGVPALDEATVSSVAEVADPALTCLEEEQVEG